MRTLMTDSIPENAPLTELDSPLVRVHEAIAQTAACSLALRQWERHHLPMESSLIGFELFLKLAQLSASGRSGQTTLLKQLYLALPYSEKGVRLHLRRLEAAGWIRVQRATKDSRGAQVELSDMAWRLLADYVQEWRRHRPSRPPD